ncbi:MAG: hypothetical protein BRD42_05940 [Bacteroidetes bacterium QS_3_64_15]|nr:MAG: hypothetical protein BRD42_05940 [Bacteroidetes bacterium QS_3_64_15]
MKTSIASRCRPCSRQPPFATSRPASAGLTSARRVSAYNGAADLLSSEAFLGAAGSIVSVEARHAAAIRDLTDPMDHFFSGEFPIGGSFAIDDNGLYEARDPQEVLGVATSFVEERFDVQGG